METADRCAAAYCREKPCPPSSPGRAPAAHRRGGREQATELPVLGEAVTLAAPWPAGAGRISDSRRFLQGASAFFIRRLYSLFRMPPGAAASPPVTSYRAPASALPPSATRPHPSHVRRRLSVAEAPPQAPRSCYSPPSPPEAIAPACPIACRGAVRAMARPDAPHVRLRPRRRRFLIGPADLTNHQHPRRLRSCSNRSEQIGKPKPAPDHPAIPTQVLCPRARFDVCHTAS